MRADRSLDPRGYPEFAIRPPGKRDEYFVADYLWPMRGSEGVHGLDLSAQPVNLASMRYARETGQPVASGPFDLIQEVSHRTGFVVRVPVFVGPAAAFGYYPSAYHTQWSNGLTLYGPPVPTFGPTPGAFGGSDAHRKYFSGGLPRYGWFGYYTPSPRPRDLTVSVYPQPPHYTGPGYDTVAPREAVPAANCSRPATIPT